MVKRDKTNRHGKFIIRDMWNINSSQDLDLRPENSQFSKPADMADFQAREKSLQVRAARNDHGLAHRNRNAHHPGEVIKQRIQRHCDSDIVVDMARGIDGSVNQRGKLFR